MRPSTATRHDLPAPRRLRKDVQRPTCPVHPCVLHEPTRSEYGDAFDSTRFKGLVDALDLGTRASDTISVIAAASRSDSQSVAPSSERVATAEIAVVDPRTWASYYGAQLDEFHLPLNFRMIAAAWNASTLRDIIDVVERAVPAGAWPTWVLGNHDEPRIASRLGAAQARVAMLMLLTLRGTPTIYNGDELAMHDVAIPPEQVRDPWEQRTPGGGLGRDPERSPMRWTGEPHGGFCPPDAIPRLPTGRTAPADAQLNEPASMLNLTRQLLTSAVAGPSLHWVSTSRYLPPTTVWHIYARLAPHVASSSSTSTTNPSRLTCASIKA